MSKRETDRSALRQALDSDWPQIQKHLLEKAAEEAGRDDPHEPYWTTDEHGKRTLHMSPDSWWLENYDEKDVILHVNGVAIMNTQLWHADSAVATFRDAYGIQRDETAGDCFTQDDILAQIARFPQGQFAAMRTSGPAAGNAVGMAITMRTSRPPTAPILPWLEAIGDLRIARHEADGDWLYGVEMAVHTMYRLQGIGTGLYEARFQMARELNLRGWYAVGMLMGYKDHADAMDVVEYGEKVIAGELIDPTVTMQMNRGFLAERVVTNYCEEASAADAGVLIVWENPDYEA